ncbi:hypothetical protein B0H67DRAFT_118001 [Lasiosphaeris hirsuta]|uniref:Uncharacterized protein n=1 Tax=Lasiosphaeris hirsuta TaxID=260670 RepID=A0AA40AZM8_9PEZI|nr:hypothetical protein B0H67DRAFT_118001 [Lasiosphaeris hirsuta]
MLRTVIKLTYLPFRKALKNRNVVNPNFHGIKLAPHASTSHLCRRRRQLVERSYQLNIQTSTRDCMASEEVAARPVSSNSGHQEDVITATSTMAPQTTSEPRNIRPSQAIESQPPGSGKGDAYSSHRRGVGNMCISFEPHAGPLAGQNMTWRGHMWIKCDDIPRLMREGLGWTTKNILPDQGLMGEAARNMMAHEGAESTPCYRRVWTLQDQSSGEFPYWLARLTVYSNSATGLHTFEPTALSRQDITKVIAWKGSERNEKIYRYEALAPGNTLDLVGKDNSELRKCPVYREGPLERGFCYLVAVIWFLVFLLLLYDANFTEV